MCDNTACERDDRGVLCSGNGSCECGDCKCSGGWTGSRCDCLKDETACRSPESPETVCSGNGVCPCNRCICTEDGYRGEFCEKCETCKSECDRLRPCVECLAFEDASLLMGPGASNETRAELQANCPCPFLYTEVFEKDVPAKIEATATATTAAEVPTSAGVWGKCTFRRQYCDYTFSHSPFRPGHQGPEQVILHLFIGGGKDDKEANQSLTWTTATTTTTEAGEEVYLVKLRCPVRQDLLGIVLGIIGCIVAVGMVTILLWKVFATIHDRREFARFEEERRNLKLSSNLNPFYVPATTTIQNPTYKKPN